ncbi:MAG: HAMP domain-containing protein [Streptosporangiales bacterium]|nr:HAMP domain-containing protein [Streptosporangiales bacterium]
MPRCRWSAALGTGWPPMAASGRPHNLRPLGRPLGGLRRWWRHRSLRARLMLVTVLPLAAVIALIGFVTVDATGRATLAAAEQTARERVRGDIKIATRAPNMAFRTAPGVPGTAPTLPDVFGQPMQVLDADGRLVTGSLSAQSLGALLDPEEARRARDEGDVFIVETGTAGRMLVVGRAATDQNGRPLTLLSAVPVEDILRSVEDRRNWMLIGGPVAVALLAGTVWVAVGFALRPVTALRRGAQAIADGAQRRRLPVADARDEIHDLALTLNDMLDRLAAASARQRSFTADAAHELRSPLASVRAQLEVALAHPEGQDWSKTGRDVLVDVQRLTRLSEDLLALARLDATSPAGPGEVGPADLGPLAATVAERFDAAGVSVAVDVGDPETRAVASPDEVDRVLTNLVANAVRHAASRVVVGVRAEPGWAVLTVIDDGPGIPAEDRERVFERFTRLDDARDQDAGGAGLGLAIVAETVSRYRGRVALADAGPGLCATVWLPSAATRGHEAS